MYKYIFYTSKIKNLQNEHIGKILISAVLSIKHFYNITKLICFLFRIQTPKLRNVLTFNERFVRECYLYAG